MTGTRKGRAAVSMLAVLAAVTLALVGCANDKSSGSSGSGSASGAATTTEAGATTTAPAKGDGGGAAASAAAVEVDGWQQVATTPNCQCSDGSPFFFYVHRGTSDRVVFYLEGGGACFSAETCGPGRPSYTRTLDASKKVPADSGIFDFADEDNPFRSDSVVFVPYCTGDLHLGAATHDYGKGVVIRHNGATNAGTALTATAALFPGATQVVVAGSSAGSAPTPAYAGLATDLFPEAKVTSIADASGAYPGTEAITTAISALWGTQNALPKWPETAGSPPSAWSLPGLYIQATKHAPQVTFAKIDTAYDETQQDFVRLAGFPDEDLMKMIDDNTAFSEAGGATIHAWVGPGTLHTILGRPDLYQVEVGGTKLIDWITDLVDGDDVPDVHCTDCGRP